jgi:hypothetical protein
MGKEHLTNCCSYLSFLFILTFQILMNVLTEATIVITTLHATIMTAHFIALVILATQEMVHFVKVSLCYFR